MDSLRVRPAYAPCAVAGCVLCFCGEEGGVSGCCSEIDGGQRKREAGPDKGEADSMQARRTR